MRRRDVVFGLMATGILPSLARALNKQPITGGLAQWKALPGTKGLEPVFEYLAALDPAQVTPGRTPIVGDEVYAQASKYTTKAVETARFEAHRKFIDVQCVLVGQETIGFVPAIEGLTVLQPYDEAKDIAFFAVPADYTAVPVKAGQFVILKNGEGHMPNCHLDGPHDVVKVVVKVSAAWYAARAK